MKKLLSVLTIIGILFLSCSKDNEKIDDIYPEINISFDGAFPQNCDTLFRGESFNVIIRLSDNKELGSYSINLHHNFDHHNHSTEIDQCVLGDVQTPVKPFLYNKAITIDAGTTNYTTNLQIEIPSDADAGDYHFMIKVTDMEGWQTMKGLSLKIF